MAETGIGGEASGNSLRDRVAGVFRLLLSREVLALVLAVMLLMVYRSYIDREAYIERLKADEAVTASENERLSSEMRRLETVKTELGTDQGVERVARERLKLVREGEILYIPRKSPAGGN